MRASSAVRFSCSLGRSKKPPQLADARFQIFSVDGRDFGGHRGIISRCEAAVTLRNPKSRMPKLETISNDQAVDRTTCRFWIFEIFEFVSEFEFRVSDFRDYFRAEFCE